MVGGHQSRLFIRRQTTLSNKESVTALSINSMGTLQPCLYPTQTSASAYTNLMNPVCMPTEQVHRLTFFPENCRKVFLVRLSSPSILLSMSSLFPRCNSGWASVLVLTVGGSISIKTVGFLIMFNLARFLSFYFVWYWNQNASDFFEFTLRNQTCKYFQEDTPQKKTAPLPQNLSWTPWFLWSVIPYF